MGKLQNGRKSAAVLLVVCPWVLTLAFGGCGPGAAREEPCEADENCSADEICVNGSCLAGDDFSGGVDESALEDMGIAEGFGGPGSGEPTQVGAVIDAFCDINAYQNGPIVESTHGSSAYGYQHQCTELAYRFLCQHYDLCEKKVGKYGNAKQWYANPYGDPVLAQLTRYKNGGSEPPRPGDAIIWKNGTYGHVAIVKSVAGGVVQVLEQNIYKGVHAYKLTESNGTYSIPNTHGWMRAPNSTPACGTTPGDNPASATLTAPTEGTSWTGAFQVKGAASDIDGLAKVTVTLNDKRVVICEANCAGATQDISTVVDPASLGMSSGSIVVAVWARDILGNEYGPMSVRTIQWQAPVAGAMCGNGSCESGETCGNCVNDCACQAGQACQSGQCVTGCAYQTVKKNADYSCGGGIVLNISGSLDAAGNLTVSATKIDGSAFGTGDYYVWVFDPNDGIPSNHCKQFNVQKSHITLASSNQSTITFPAFGSQLMCGGPAKGYCVTKSAGGDNAWFGSHELVATYQ